MSRTSYECLTCGAAVYGVTAARKHAKQGRKTQREAFQGGQLHILELVVKEMRNYPYTADDGTTRWACCDSSIGPTCEHTRKDANNDNA